MEVSKKFNGLKEDLGNSISYMYVVTDVPEHTDGDDTEFRQLIADALPQYENNIKMTNLQIGDQLNNTTWIVTAEYKTENNNFPNQSSMSFDTSGATAHKTNDLKLVDSWVAIGGGAFAINPDAFKEGQPVGFNGEDVEGIDIVIPSFKFTEVHPIPDTAMTSAYRKKLLSLTGTTNKAAFRDFEAGEVLFTGSSGSKNGTEKWLMTFNFEALPNKTNVKAGGITIDLKKGWEYIAIRYKKQLSDDKTRINVTPLQVDVHKMYEESDFADLGITTGTWEEVVQNDPETLEQSLFPFGQ